MIFFRMPAFYFLHFFGVGVMLPFVNIFYDSVGIEGFRLGILNASPRVAAMIMPFIFGAIADKYKVEKRLIFFSTLLASFIAFFLWNIREFWFLFFLITFYYCLKSPVVPIVENLCLKEAKKSGVDYGKIRWWGSLGFIVAALTTGKVIDIFEENYIFLLVSISGLVSGFFILLVPKNNEKKQSFFFSHLFASIWKDKNLLRFFFVSIIVSATSGPFGLYFSIHLKSLGLSSFLIGFAWILGVVSEIFFLFFAGKIRSYIGVKIMIIIGILATAIRWELIAIIDDIFFLISTQVLHGLTFGILHPASIQYIDTQSTKETKNTVQSLYSASTYGIGSTIGVLSAGAFINYYSYDVLLHVSSILALLGVLIFLFPVRNKIV
ncbi:MAG: MFS transporter [Nitrospinota bacterium]|nr:MFS transporter [Nitrospinota bacterium]